MKMSTTQVFIELLITGFGGLIWITFLVFGFGNIPLETIMVSEVSNLILFPISGIAYIIGILIDRIGYQLLSIKEQESVLNVFPEEEERAKIPYMITFITENSERLTGKIDYNRSRLRLCRSWILNFFFIAISVLFYAILANIKYQVGFVIIFVIALLLCIACFIVWKKLSRDYYLNIRSSFKNLKQLKGTATIDS